VPTPAPAVAAPLPTPAVEQATSFKKDLGSASSKPDDDADAANGAALPEWAPIAALVAAALVVIVIAVNVFTAPSPQPAPAVRAPAAPVVVKVEEETPPPVKETPPPVKTVPKPASPAAAKPSPPPAAPQAVAQPTRKPEELPFARQVASGAASGLRAAADLLPQAERAVEQSAPAINSGLQKIATGDPDQALPVIGSAVATGADAAARTGLKLFSSGLGVIADSLPVVGQVAGDAFDAALPTIQSGVRSSAEAARSFANSLPAPSDPNNIGEAILPNVLKGTASGLEVIADVAPTAEKAISYAAGKALPVLQSGLKATSQVSADAADAKTPDAAQVAGALKSVGVDPSDVANKAANLAREAAEKASKKVAEIQGAKSSSLAEVAPSLSTPSRLAGVAGTAP
jgi:hypothetical protein